MTNEYLLKICLLVLYTSLAEGKGGGGGGETADLKVEGSGNSQIGGTYTITCTIPPVHKPVGLFWFRGQDLVYLNDGLVWTGPKVEGTIDTLASTEDFRTTNTHWMKLTSLGTVDGGKYKCVVRTIRDELLTGDLELAIGPDDIKIKSNQIPLHLHCGNINTSHSNSDHVFIWKKDSVLVSINNITVKNDSAISLVGSTLVLNVTSSSTGEYACYNNGILVHSYKVSFYVAPGSQVSVLSGWRGYTFGGSLGFIIFALLVIANYIQNDHDTALKKMRKESSKL